MAVILIVDDLSDNRKFLVTLLNHRGHRLLEAADGSEALAVVRAEHPDLVITDVLMPVMDGYEFVRQLRLDPTTSRTPVVFSTAHYGEREARTLALSSSVSYVLSKPAAPAEVLEIVKRALSGESETGMAPGVTPLTTEFDREHLRLLTDKLSEHTGDLRAANARLRAVINIGLELASKRDADQLLHDVCVAARDLFGATYVTLGILDQRDATVQRLSVCGADEAWEAQTASWIKTGDSVAGMLATVIAERRTLRGDNPGGDPTSVQLPLRHPEVRTFLAAPIASPSHVYGWICLVGNEARAFTEDDENLLTALSGQVGRIYENAYLYANAQKRAEELEHEIAERRLAESALRQERNRAQQYLDTAQVILVRLDAEGRIALVNRYGCSVLGWREDELLGRDWFETCLPSRLWDANKQTRGDVIAGDFSVVESAILTKSGEERTIEWRNTQVRDDAGNVVGTFSSGTDITERNRAAESLRETEAQYQQAQKMEAVGRLAGGVAHDFNNLLTAILGYCELLLIDLEPNDPRMHDIAEIQKAGRRGAGLTRQLLAFSRKQIIEPTVLDLNAVVTDMRPMIGTLIGEDVKVVLALRLELCRMKADRGQIEQIVMNLAVNARDAMPNGGTLTIETASVESSPWVMLRVSDTGTGMTPDVQARLFEPFFTTKEAGKGTGLGLATVHSIVTRSGGTIRVQSEIGRGSTFSLYFPIADPADLMAARMPTPISTRRIGTETVLVVEDADGLRELTSRLLQHEGYSVRVAANAGEAIELFEQDTTIDVLLTDVVMPGLSGPELAKRLVALRPGLKVIYMSGYTDDAIVRHGVLNPGIALLQKPFTSQALSLKIREALATVTSVAKPR